MPEPVWTLWE